MDRHSHLHLDSAGIQRSGDVCKMRAVVLGVDGGWLTRDHRYVVVGRMVADGVEIAEQRPLLTRVDARYGSSDGVPKVSE